MLRIIREHEDALEADLSQHHRIRYTDRWRRDERGVPLLTLREIWVRIRQLPPTAQLVMARNGGRPRWTDADYLLSDIAGILAGRPHPNRPTPTPQAAPTEREQPRRAALRQRRIKAKREREARLAQEGGAPDE